MTRTASRAWLVGMIVAAVSIAAHAQTGRTPRGTTMARGLLRLTLDRDSLPRLATLSYLVESDAVLAEAVRQTLKQPLPVDVTMRYINEDRPGRPLSVLVPLEVTVQGEVPRADVRKLLAAVTKRLGEALAQAARHQRELTRKELTDVAAQVNSAKSKLATLQDARAMLLTAAGVVDLDRDRIINKIRSLESKRESLAVSVAGAKVRVDATQEQVAKLAARARDAVKDDPVAAELAKVIEYKVEALRGREAAFAKKMATREEILQAAAQVAEAKVRLAQRREQAAAAAAGELLAKLSARLVEDSINMMTEEAQLMAIMAQLKPLRDPKLLRLADQYEPVQFEMRLAERRYQEAASRRGELERQLATARPPTLIIMGGEPKAAVK